ncbi:DUF4286 family protein [Arthrobacter sp. MMS18-M83]|uniref:DUF4286 family protein n=1 Tax=Arthrobacter sp. MMS18-M83 TaxID=2996261 RepID=UPI00227D5312|nr:DUF4286 family protein [Arthrobacter sp. MMS18-M83]WAH97662.1 hypothetical protein OW521_01815 [Arthrobacter sp. MMS18-M83]
MPTSIYFVQTNAVSGEDEAFNQWYDAVHIPQILQIPGFVAAQRFEFDPKATTAPAPDYRYAAVYEVEGSGADAAAALRRAIPYLQMSETLDASRSLVLYKAITDRIVAP